MKIIISEDKIPVLLSETLKEFNNYDGNAYHNPYQKILDVQDQALDDFIATNGKIMVDIENGKDYLVYEIYALSELLGKRYAMCKVIRENKPFGVIYIKPFANFREKI